MSPAANISRVIALAPLPVGLDTSPMEARLVSELRREPGWQFEPKWDAFCCLAFWANDEVELGAKSGTSLTRYFPEMVSLLRGVKPQHFVVDGELAIQIDKSLSFDALPMRLHLRGKQEAFRSLFRRMRN